MEDNENGFQIRSQLDYEALKKDAKEKLFLSTNRSVMYALEGLIGLIIGLFFAIHFPFVESAVPRFNVAFSPINAFFSAIRMICLYFAIFCLLVIIKSIKSLKKHIVVYQGDLRRIQEKLTYSEIYMKIPQEDIEEYSNPIKLIIAVVKRKLEERDKK